MKIHPIIDRIGHALYKIIHINKKVGDRGLQPPQASGSGMPDLVYRFGAKFTLIFLLITDFIRL